MEDHDNNVPEHTSPAPDNPDDGGEDNLVDNERNNPNYVINQNVRYSLKNKNIYKSPVNYYYHHHHYYLPHNLPPPPPGALYNVRRSIQQPQQSGVVNAYSPKKHDQRSAEWHRQAVIKQQFHSPMQQNSNEPSA
uniref:Uncharacterized protein n=1 Tax=Romanomermis culicivorax TaxID=13658 RepID=A0A915KV38_ROMCU